MAVLFANKGFQVTGVDIDRRLVDAVNRKECPIFEPGVSELLNSAGGKLTATDNFTEATENSGASFIIVPTPSEASGGFSTKYVEAAIKKLAESLKHKNEFHLVVITSTILPGSTVYLKELLEKGSGRKCGTDLGLCYNPEFIALGNVLHGLSCPDLVLIGESDPRAGEMLSRFYKGVCENKPPVVRTSFYNAELGKILLNAYVTMKISFANTIAELCERMPGGDADAISKILGLDSRIGRKYLSGGLAFGGPCFPRDNRAVAHFAKSVNVDAQLAKTSEAVNGYQNKRVIGLIREMVGELRGKKIAILGLTYKPDTDVVEEAAPIKIIKFLLEEEAQVSVYDPAGMKNTRSILADKIRYANSTQECLKEAECCLLATPWGEFKNLGAEDFVKHMKEPVLLDCWRVFNGPEFSKKLKYFAIGLSPK